MMLFLEPVKNYREKFPLEIVGMITVLAAIGFKGSLVADLEEVNLGRAISLIEKDGRFIYDGQVAGYLRALRPEGGGEPDRHS
jgi:hypothetical protein